MSASMSSDQQVIGHYFDGKTAITHDVFGLQMVGMNLVIHCLDGGKIEWALAEIDRKDDGSSLELMRFGIKSSPDERLILLKTGVAALSQIAPNLTSKKQINARHRRTLLFVGGFAAALVAFVFVGLPMASYPIAHMLPLETEEALGESAKMQVSGFMQRCEGEAGQEALRRVADQLLAHVDTPRVITVELMEADFPNAMALPGGTIYVTDDLIALMKSPDELAGVLGHEIGHLERRDSMAGLIRQLGFAWLLDAMVGGSGIVQGVVSGAGGLASLHYSRAAESGSDDHGIKLMRAAGLNPVAMADFFEHLKAFEEGEGAEKSNVDKAAEDTSHDGAHKTPKANMDVFATHPDSLKRATAIRAKLTPAERGNVGFAPAASSTDWLLIRTACSDDQQIKLPDLPFPLPGKDPVAEGDAAPDATTPPPQNEGGRNGE